MRPVSLGARPALVTAGALAFVSFWAAVAALRIFSAGAVTFSLRAPSAHVACSATKADSIVTVAFELRMPCIVRDG
jgi:hypothetical protein